LRSQKGYDVVRNAAIRDVWGALTATALKTKFFSTKIFLFGEGHRWIDMRRFERISELPNERSEMLYQRFLFQMKINRILLFSLLIMS
jgi:hypothetical protein